MFCFRKISFVLLPAILLAHSVCGGGSGSGNFNPVSATSSSTSPTFSNTSSATGKYTISLSVDRPSINVGIGQVLATATVASSNGTTIEDRPVTFSVAAGPAVVDPGLVTVTTDSNGNAVIIIAPGNVLTTTNM